MSSPRNFTVRFIESIHPPGEGVEVYWDAAVPSFGLHVYSSGKKTWKIMYRVNGRLRNKKIGTYPATSLADAREQAQEVIREAKKGKDILDKRSREMEGDPTFPALAQAYLEIHAKPKKRQWRTDERLIHKELLSKWKGLRAAEITRRDVIALLDGLVNRGAPIQANRVHALISKIFNWAVSRDLLEFSPCHQVKKPSNENQRDRVLSEYEIGQVWRAFGEQQVHVSAIFKLMLLTAQRRWEVSQMRFTDIDLKSGWWTIPGDFAKNGRSHRVPLSVESLKIIKSLPKPAKDQVWLFPSPTRKGQPIANVQKAAQRVRGESGVDNFVLHDLRRTASTVMASNGVTNFVVARILNHSEPGVTQVYNRYSYDSEKREALEIWERKLLDIVGSNEEQSPDEQSPPTMP